MLRLHDKAPGLSAARQNVAASSTATLDVPNTKLLVSNLHYEVTPRDLTVSHHRTPFLRSGPTIFFGGGEQQVFGVMGTLVREPLIRVR